MNEETHTSSASNNKGNVSENYETRSLDVMMDRSLTLQTEIEKLFEDYEKNNDDMRGDIDDFCEIYESSMVDLSSSL